MTLSAGTRLGPYEILSPIGAGGMGEVYRARDSKLQRGGVEAFPAAYYRHQLARIYMIVGEPEKALDQIERLLKEPYWLTPAWLKIDPKFDPLRGNPRFQKLIAAAK